MNFKNICTLKELDLIKDEKDKKLFIRLRRLQRIVEYLRQKYQARVYSKIFEKGSKYISSWNKKVYIYDGRYTMIPLKKDGTKSLIGEEIINLWTMDKWKKL